jgi:hypothetical protein
MEKQKTTWAEKVRISEKMDIFIAIRRNIGVFCLYAVCSLAALSPISGYKNFFPSATQDFPRHVLKVNQATVALKEHQFPLRVGLLQNGLNYPFFQFYSSFPYMIAAFFANTFCHSNAFAALKITIWLAVLLGGFYIYRLATEISEQPIAALLAGIAYMAAPYLLININARGDFTEVVAQGLVPLVLYHSYKLYSVKMYFSKDFFMTSFAWALLTITHLVTFVNSSMMIGLFFLFLTLLHKGHYFKRLLWLGSAYSYSFLLASWFVVPILKYSSLLNIDYAISDPINYNFLTTLPRLLAMVSAGRAWPPPYADSTTEWVSPPFYPAIGWVMLFAGGVSFYKLYLAGRFKSLEKIPVATLKVYHSLLWIFFVGVFFTWSPIDFWKHLPRMVVITQFSYRFLTQVMWAGALLLPLAISAITRSKYSLQTLCVGTLLITLHSSSWLMTHHVAGTSVSLLDLSWDEKNAYLLKPTLALDEKTMSKTAFPSPLLPIVSFEKVKKNCSYFHQKLQCRLMVHHSSLYEFPFFYYPDLLRVTVDEHPVSYMPTKVQENWLVKLPLAPGLHRVQIKFSGLVWANWVSVLAWGVLLLGILVSLIKHSYRRINLAKGFILA